MTRARTLKDRDWVRTADGTEGRVSGDPYLTYDHATGAYIEPRVVRVRLADESETIELPVSELTRIPDPQNRRPPIEGMPAGPRPQCAACHKPLRFWTDDERQLHDHTKPFITKRTFVRWRGYGRARGSHLPIFCTLSCALAFASAAHHAGYRIKV